MIKVTKNINTHGEGYFLDIESDGDKGFIAVDGEGEVTLICNPENFLDKSVVESIISEYVM